MKIILLKKLLILSCTCLLVLSNYAQEVIVKGRLADSASAKPVTNATINFLQLQKKVSTTIISDQSGAFQINLPAGGYNLTVTHSSYRKKVMPLKVEGEPIDLGTLLLNTSVKSLGNVKVTAARPMVEQQGDRLIYNVEEDPAGKTESASDLLRKTPYVTVDGDGAVQVNGQSNFRVLLNGRETAMFSQNVKEALKGFPGANIARIEVITSPSAKYDAEGIGGIINIITKKKLAGYNGSVNSNISTLGHRGAGFNINVKTGKLGITGMYNHMTNGGILSQQVSVTTPLQQFAFARREVGGSKDNEMFFHNGNLEISYDVDSFNTVVVYGNVGKNNVETFYEQNINTLFANGTSDLSPYLLETTSSSPSYGFGSDFIRKYKGKPQKELTFRFNAIYNTNNTLANSQQDLGPYERFLLNNSEAFNREYTLQGDLVQPLTKTTKLETGIKTIFRKAHSDFDSRYTFDKADPYVIDPSNSDRFSYDQHVYGGYVSVSKNSKTLTSRIGVRVEHTEVDGEFTSTNTEVVQSYTNLIPNVFLQKQFSKTYTSNFTYNFRLGRPSISNLNPFVNNSDTLNLSSGNPNLGPQSIHQFSWQNRFFKGSKFISVNTGFNISNTLIIQNPVFDPSTGISFTKPANAGQFREFTLGFTSNLPVGKRWNFALNSTGRIARMRNNLQTSWMTNTAGNANANISWKATENFTLQTNGGYFVPMRTPNNTYPDNYFYVVNFLYKAFKSKLNLTLSVSNFLEKERTLRSFTKTANFTTENLSRIPFRNVGLSMSYNFGKLKEKVSKKKGVSNDDAVE